MDDEKPVLEQMTDAMSSAADATKEAAKTAVKKVRKGRKRIAKKVTPKKKAAKKAKKAQEIIGEEVSEKVGQKSRQEVAKEKEGQEVEALRVVSGKLEAGLPQKTRRSNSFPRLTQKPSCVRNTGRRMRVRRAPGKRANMRIAAWCAC